MTSERDDERKRRHDRDLDDVEGAGRWRARAREADGVTADADSAAVITACIIAGDCASADKPRKMSFERVSPGRASEKDE